MLVALRSLAQLLLLQFHDVVRGPRNREGRGAGTIVLAFSRELLGDVMYSKVVSLTIIASLVGMVRSVPAQETVGSVADPSAIASEPLRSGRSAHGKLDWQDQFDKAGGPDELHQVVESRGRVFAVGIVTNSLGNYDMTVRAYQAETGKLLWRDRFDGSGDFDNGSAIATDGDRVYAAGISVNGGVSDFLVRAYDAQTGKLLWQDVSDQGGGSTEADAIAVQGNRVFVGGVGRNHALLRVYDARTGLLQWSDEFVGSGPTGDGQFLSVAARGTRVWVAGWVQSPTGEKADWLVRAYHSVTGALIWEDEFAAAALVQKIVVDRNLVATVGNTSEGLDSNFLVRVYDADSGTLAWQNARSENGGGQGIGIAAGEGRVFAGGSGVDADGVFHFLVRGFDASSGALLWEDQMNDGGGAAISVVLSAGEAYVAGTTNGPTADGVFVVRAYDCTTGTLSWADENESGYAYSVAASGQRAFAGGAHLGPVSDPGNTDILLRAYKPR